jgi:hypothetical protein
LRADRNDALAAAWRRHRIDLAAILVPGTAARRPPNKGCDRAFATNFRDVRPAIRAPARCGIDDPIESGGRGWDHRAPTFATAFRQAGGDASTAAPIDIKNLKTMRHSRAGH